MITCNVFDLQLAVDGRKLRWQISTDLPGGTRVIVDIRRYYENSEGEQQLWMLWSDSILLTNTGPGDFNGAAGEIDIDEGDARGLVEFNRLLGPYSSGAVKPVGPEVHVQATVGLRQPLKAFGKNNCNLSGDMVSEDSRGMHFVEREASASLEMSGKFQPVQRDR